MTERHHDFAISLRATIPADIAEQVDLVEDRLEELLEAWVIQLLAIADDYCPEDLEGSTLELLYYSNDEGDEDDEDEV